MVVVDDLDLPLCAVLGETNFMGRCTQRFEALPLLLDGEGGEAGGGVDLSTPQLGIFAGGGRRTAEHFHVGAKERSVEELVDQTELGTLRSIGPQQQLQTERRLRLQLIKLVF